jgi:hypothetical protein
MSGCFHELRLPPRSVASCRRAKEGEWARGDERTDGWNGTEDDHARRCRRGKRTFDAGWDEGARARTSDVYPLRVRASFREDVALARAEVVVHEDVALPHEPDARSIQSDVGVELKGVSWS